MSSLGLFLIIIFSIAIWMTVSKEATKDSEEISRPKMLTLLTAGSISTIILVITLVQSLNIF
ncbi:conserved hypothetical protein [Exiguobacterium sibiricum 255-15]|uniref:Uncharacterized protein n=1 Tax=Exiguobacterium sibiricum (strain DSM 17290 / CCUG 55495 / CIP 109462 / JCM 13490 / 255-15) TaxID=262543 RepID=B1YFT5_EXIS2|nr:hypothetical protein [Exiguobacterium sibiricum]ACB60862.1 conserved hypothetical protein [Exiguobacterium sibiricum 255-15]